jgi:predicted secreted hydrolase
MMASVVYPQDWKVYPYTPQGSLVSFPYDEGWHPGEPIEWWYIAGHLEGQSSGTSFSFMLSYFYYPASVSGFEFDGFRILNLANDDTGEFFTETQPVVEYTDLASDHLYLDVQLYNGVQESWLHREEPPGTRVPFEYEVSASAEHGEIALSAVLQKRPLIPGGDGLFDQGASSYTYYYSLTDMQVTGSIDFNGTTEEVSGTAWIDRQYGSFNPNTQEKYEWFYLQLSNGMDLNIWNLFTPGNLLPDQEAYKHLSVYVDENTQYTEHDFTLERLGWSCLPGSGNCYAQQWSLTSEMNHLDLVISTLHHNSEVALPFNFFEGAIEASGTVNGMAVDGKGFAELLKNYTAPQIRMESPKETWNASLPITWTVLNPDQGRPLLFDLMYSTDQGNTWLPVELALSDTFYLWNSPPLSQGDSCLFKLSGYTADHSLEGSIENPMHTLYDDAFTGMGQDPAPGFRIYPNPATHSLRIQWEASQAHAASIPYQIMDFLGRQVDAGSVSEGEIDVSQLPIGLYLILLKGSGDTVSQIFMKQ